MAHCLASCAELRPSGESASACITSITRRLGGEGLRDRPVDTVTTISLLSVQIIHTWFLILGDV